MGRCETATAYIGLKILLSELILQINETNFTQIKEMLCYGFIEDDNNYFNEVYHKIMNNNKLPENYLDYKEYLENKFKNNGTYFKSRGYNQEIPTLNDGCLFDKELLFPVKKILTMDRWGDIDSRDGPNCVSRPIDFDLSINIEKYKEIEKTKIVFLLAQHSG
jgi:hypothetical protein